MAERVLVCGAGGALGAAVVAAFAARGDEVLAPTRAELDLGDPDAVEAYWVELGRRAELPRYVVNTAGGFRPGTVAETDADAVRATLALNLETVWWTAAAAARRLERGGAIVNVASRAAISGGVGSAAYAVAKAAVIRFTEVLAEELAPRGVRANAVVPGLIDTPQNRAALSQAAMARAVAPARIAAVIAYLCSDDAEAVTGAALPVDAA